MNVYVDIEQPQKPNIPLHSQQDELNMILLTLLMGYWERKLIENNFMELLNTSRLPFLTIPRVQGSRRSERRPSQRKRATIKKRNSRRK